MIEHSGESEEGEKVNLGNVTEEREGTKARLSWEDGERKVFTGVVALERELDLTVRVSFRLSPPLSALTSILSRSRRSS